MPPSTRAYIVQRFHQADTQIVKAQEALASVYATLVKSHPEDSHVIVKVLALLDAAREGIRVVAMPTYTATPRTLYKEGDLDIILANAKPLPDPHYRSQKWAHQRTLPSQTPERHRQRMAKSKARKA